MNPGLAEVSGSAISLADNESLIPVSDPLTNTLIFVPTVAKRLSSSFMHNRDLDTGGITIFFS